MEVGCLRHPVASTIGSQLLDGDYSHDWQIQPTQPCAPMRKEKIQAPITLIKQWKEREGRQPSRSPHSQENANAQKTMTKTLTKPLQRPVWIKNTMPGACALFNKPLTARVKLVLLVVNSVQLHLTACDCFG